MIYSVLSMYNFFKPTKNVNNASSKYIPCKTNKKGQKECSLSKTIDYHYGEDTEFGWDECG